jgi:DNA-binding transcriptional ArsR family regulator
MGRGCSIQGRYVEPESCLKVLGHPLRRRILHKLAVETLDGPISKKELAKKVGISYPELLYQLNKQLKGFWEVKREQKRRGAHEEFIAPPMPNTIYVMLGEGATIYLMDPLANIFGRISEGTRCDGCSSAQISKCLEKTKSDRCFEFTREEAQKQEKLISVNKRPDPPTPIDRIIGCIAFRSLEGEGCAIEVCETECNFMKKVRANLRKPDRIS